MVSCAVIDGFHSKKNPPSIFDGGSRHALSFQLSKSKKLCSPTIVLAVIIVIVITGIAGAGTGLETYMMGIHIHGHRFSKGINMILKKSILSSTKNAHFVVIVILCLEKTIFLSILYCSLRDPEINLYVIIERYAFPWFNISVFIVGTGSDPL